MWELVLFGGSGDFTIIDIKYSECRSDKNGKKEMENARNRERLQEVDNGNCRGSGMIPDVFGEFGRDFRV